MLDMLGSVPEVWRMLEHQFSVLHQRTQTLFTLGALAITVTGFSGHRIISTGFFSSIPLVLGLGFVLAALFTALYGVFKIRWISAFQGRDHTESLILVLKARDRKTRLYNCSLMLLILGLVFYVLAVSHYLVKASLLMPSLGWDM